MKFVCPYCNNRYETEESACECISKHMDSEKEKTIKEFKEKAKKEMALMKEKELRNKEFAEIAEDLERLQDKINKYCRKYGDSLSTIVSRLVF